MKEHLSVNKCRTFQVDILKRLIFAVLNAQIGHFLRCLRHVPQHVVANSNRQQGAGENVFAKTAV